MSKHDAVGATAGDDWEVRVTLLDESGAPFDLSGNPTIQWTLLDQSYKRVIETTEVIISLTDAVAGKCTVMVPRTVTTRLATGLYTDALRLVMGGVASTLLTGDYNVVADPFGVAAAAPAVSVVKLQRTAA